MLARPQGSGALARRSPGPFPGGLAGSFFLTGCVAIAVMCLASSPAAAQVQAPEPLPSGPLGPRLIFETPWSFVVAAVLLAVAIGLGRAAALRPVGRRAPARAAALVFVALALGVVIAQAVVRTPREQLALRTRELVDAVAAGDAERLRPMLAADCTASYLRSQSGIGKELILAQVVEAFGSGEPAEARVGVLQTIADNDSFGRAQLRVTVNHDLTSGYPLGSWWMVRWQRRAGASGGSGGMWEATEIRLLAAPGVSGPG